jgi:hypothetical protein
MALKIINKSTCSALISRRGHGIPCKNSPISRKTIARWRDQGKITSDQAQLAFAAKPYCAKHLADLLDAMAPGTKAKIIGDAYKDRGRYYHNGLIVIEKMRRANLIPKQSVPRPPANRRCIARSKRHHGRCGCWAMPGTTACYHHGGAWSNKRTPAERQARAQMRLQRSYERQKRRAAGLLPSSVGYKAESQPQRTLEDEFKAARGAPQKPFKPPY